MKLVLLATLICLVAAASFLAIAGRSSRPSQDPAQQKASSDDQRALREAYKRGGLREVAKLKGVYVTESNPHWDTGRFDVESLTKGSAAVIVGRFTKKLDARLIDGKVIFTDYEVAVEELVKGDLKQAKTIVVTLPGGRIFFEDGTSAEQTTPTFEHPHIGRAYTLFLTEEAAVPSVLFLSGGPQGLFDLEDSNHVKSHGRPDDPGAVETKGKNRDEFMRKVRENARKWPKPGKCCG
ncbi:MAG: hypothetical protein ACXW3C_06835, partial [Pyrinomonadaceae bacterium]